MVSRCLFWGIVSTLMFSFLSYGATLNVSANINNGTCDVVSNNNLIIFNPISHNVFNERKQTLQIISFNLELKNCMTLSGGVMRHGVRVTGDVSQEDRYLFQKLSKDSAEGVGIILREGEYMGTLRNFYDQSLMVSDGMYTHIAQAGEAAVNKNLIFTVGLSNGDSQSPVTPGDVLAYLEFSFVYH